MKLKSSIVAIIALSSMSFAGGDIGGATTFENTDYIEAEVGAVEPVISEPAVRETVVQEVKKPDVVAVKKEEPKQESSTPAGAFYIGVAVSAMATRLDDRANVFGDERYQDRQTGITGVIGYDFMDYLGAELRAAISVDGANGNNDDMQQFGLYLKPKMPLMDDKMNIYGLLGYSMINMSDDWDGVNEIYDGDNDGFSFGLGLDYGVTENISVFTDYVNYLRNYGGTNSQWGANLGLKYNF
ncbi:putative outer membrane protein A [hydrothermal vent metagenome]|uniref:Putative outer membrane protein A n=1 Tax=hydrothermal vent metagenome TaxID=652676 RepID=A0A1W1CK60_9ZZZZ